MLLVVMSLALHHVNICCSASLVVVANRYSTSLDLLYLRLTAVMIAAHSLVYLLLVGAARHSGGFVTRGWSPSRACVLHSTAGKGFGTDSSSSSKAAKSKATPKARKPAAPVPGTQSFLEDENMLKRVAQRFVALKNAGDLDTLIRLCAQDVDVYGTQGLAAAEPVLREFSATHPELHHEIRDMALLEPGKVGYTFTKTWVDPDTAEKKEWVSFDADRCKMETLTFYADGRIKAMAIEKYDSWPPTPAV